MAETLPPFGAARRIREAAVIAAAVGVVHASAERFVLALFGVASFPVGGLLVAVVAFLASFVVLSVVALLPVRPKVPGGVDPRTVCRGRLAVALAVVYTLLAIRRLDLHEPITWAVVPVLVGLTVLITLARHRLAASRVGLALTAAVIVFAAIGGASWIHAPSEFLVRLAAWPPWIRRLLKGTLLAAPGLVALALAVLHARRPLRHPVGAVASLIVVLVCAEGVGDLSLGLDVRDRRPAPAEVADDRASSQPNIVLVVVDTVAARFVEPGADGRSAMPRLAAFARQQADMATSIDAPAPWTPATHASIFTGLWPSAHGCHKPGPDDLHGKRYCLPLRTDVPTLAGWLARHGYRTALFSANPVLGYLGLSRGFQESDARPDDVVIADAVSWARAAVVKFAGGQAGLRFLPDGISRRTLLFDPFRRPWRQARQVADEALDWIENHPGGERFVFVNFLEAHCPYYPQHRRDLLASASREALEHPNRIWETYAGSGRMVPPELVATYRQLYLESLHELDDELGRFLDALSRRDDFDRTLLIVTSDHGEEFMEHGQLEHSSDVYEAQIRVPFLIRFPRPHPSPMPRLSDSFQHTDIFPSIAALVDPADRPDTEGTAWGVDRDWAMSEVFAAPQQSPRYLRGQRAVRMGPLKYVLSSDGREELFDLSRDAGETRDVGVEQIPAVAALRRVAWERERRFPVETEAPESVSQEELRRLRSLGYVR